MLKIYIIPEHRSHEPFCSQNTGPSFAADHCLRSQGSYEP